MENLKYSAHPRTVYLEILYGCNLYCSYCYIGRDRNHTQPHIPPIETTKNILNSLKIGDVEEVVLLGGEPMLHPRFAEICRTIVELDFPYRGVVTNGTAISLKKAQLLRESSFWVDISFRGPDASTFDAIAGKAKSYQKALDAALLLSNLGMQVGIEFDCIPQNYDQLYQTIKMLVATGVQIKQLQLHRIMPEGDAKRNFEEFFLTLDQWRMVFEQAARIQRELSIAVVFEDGFPFCLVEHKYWDLITPCPCGFTMLAISPTGDARHCICQGRVLGNILHDPLTRIWEESLQDYRSISRHHSVCQECDLFEVCRGGCSASDNIEAFEGTDVFHKQFRPIKLNCRFKPETKLILGQGICKFKDHYAA